MQDPTPRLAALGAIAIALGALAAWLVHAASYFFLFDDFALVGQAAREPVGAIVAQPLFGFYRPFVFLAAKGQFALYGWSHPAGYLFTSVALHVATSALTAALAWRLWRTAFAAVAAGVVVLCSPWAAEAVFWASGAFDLWSAFGVLLVLHGCLPGPAATLRVTLGRAVLVLCGAVVALLSKESAVVVVAVVPLLWLAGRRRPQRVDLGLLAVVAVACAAYLAARSQVLSLAGGVYGGWFALVADAPLADNAARFGRAFLQPPMAHDAAWRATGLARVLAPTAPFVALGLLAWGWRQWRVVAPLWAAVLVSLAPVAWIGVHAASSAGGRVLYAPGILMALLLGVGLDAAMRPASRAVRVAVMVACVWLGAAYAVSLHDQRAGWAEATRLARAGIDAFRPYVGRTGTLHIRNLPFWFEEGPYVLKSYAFGYYYSPAAVPQVIATASTLALVDGKARAVTRGPEPGAAPGTIEGATEVTLPLGLD